MDAMVPLVLSALAVFGIVAALAGVESRVGFRDARHRAEQPARVVPPRQHPHALKEAPHVAAPGTDRARPRT